MTKEPKHPLDDGFVPLYDDEIELRPQSDTPEQEVLDQAESDDKAKPRRPALYNYTLMEVFKFTREDLAANRQGFVTQNQRAHLETHLKEMSDGTWQLVTVFLGVVLFIAVITIGGDNMAAILIGASLFLGPLLYIAFRRQQRLFADTQKPHIKQLRGNLRAGVGINGGYVQIKDERFELTLEEAMTLTQYDEAYVDVFYVPNARRIISVEIIDTDEEKLKNDLTTNEADDFESEDSVNQQVQRR